MTTPTLRPSPQQQPARRRRTTLVAVVIGLVMLVTGGLAFRWWRTPDVFVPVPSTVNEGGTWSFAKTNTWGMSYVRMGVDVSQSVSVVSVSPNVLVNTAKATITVQVCTPNARAQAIGGVAEIRRWCSRLVPADGATMRLTRPADQLVMTVTPTQHGTVLVHGLHVTYTYGCRRGSQDVGEFIRQRAL